MPAKRSKTAKKPKNSPDLAAGIMLAKRERERAWVPPWTSAMSPAMRKKSALESRPRASSPTRV